MPIVIRALGTVTPLATVTVKTQITGQLVQVAFTEGQSVKKGDLLAVVDPRPYEVALQNAKGTLAKDEALLKNAQIDLQRYKTLVAQELDRPPAVRHPGRPGAPVRGPDHHRPRHRRHRQAQPHLHADHRAGEPAASACASSTRATTSPGRRDRHLRHHPDAADLRDVHHPGRCPAAGAQASARRRHPAGDGARPGAEEPARPGQGRHRPTTRSTRPPARSSCARSSTTPDEALFPNQFVNVRLLADTVKDAITVPVAAIQRGQPGTFVYFVKADDTVDDPRGRDRRDRRREDRHHQGPRGRRRRW